METDLNAAPTRAAGYTRVSTEGQAQHGFSLETQAEDIIRLCDLKGWELVDIYSDPGVSGAAVANRPGLRRLLSDAALGKFSRVLVSNMDRFSRDLADFWVMVSRLRESDVSLAATNLPDIHSLTKEFYLLYGGPSGQAQYDRELRHERQAEGIRKMREEGKHYGRSPRGFVRNRAGFLEPDALGKRAIEILQASSKISLRDLAQELGLKDENQAYKIKRVCERFLDSGAA
jgi:site-specific DNA recombinase